MGRVPAHPLVSLVVPVRGDAAPLAALLGQCGPAPELEVIVSVGGPLDEGLQRLREARRDAVWLEGPPGRGRQLNAGAAAATGRWLWFVHADSRLPDRWLDVFRQLDAGPVPPAGGSFRFTLDSPAWQARLLEGGVAARVRLFGLPYGDQGIFVRRDVFLKMQGFRPLPLMEDVEFVGRLKRQGRVAHLSIGLMTSARRWEARGWWRQSAANLVTLGLYGLGVSPERLARRYDRQTR